MMKKAYGTLASEEVLTEIAKFFQMRQVMSQDHIESIVKSPEFDKFISGVELIKSEKDHTLR